MNKKAAYWKEHYQHQHSKSSVISVAKSLDYSNERVRLQTYAIILEGADNLSGKSVLDVGCGWGSLSLIFYHCGATVLGVDLVPETIELLNERYPFISWQALDLMDNLAVSQLPAYDRIVATEVLQCVDFEPAVQSLWSKVRPGGRLIGSVPNSACPIVQKAVEREVKYWMPVSVTQIRNLRKVLPDVREIYMKGLTFRDDQRFWPYLTSDWNPTVQGSPNRIVFVIIRNE